MIDDSRFPLLSTLFNADNEALALACAETLERDIFDVIRHGENVITRLAFVTGYLEARQLGQMHDTAVSTALSQADDVRVALGYFRTKRAKARS